MERCRSAESALTGSATHTCLVPFASIALSTKIAADEAIHRMRRAEISKSRNPVASGRLLR
jgi:hypothetical protein